jgi:FtsP/CotA-like multicopper oxidase with cupredoxin domain
MKKIIFMIMMMVLAACQAISTQKTVDVQEAYIKVDGMEYVPSEIYVVKGKTVKFTVDGRDAQGCVEYFTIPSLGINARLKKGDNVFEFTPKEAGEIPFSCSMNMVKGKIVVVESLDNVKEKTETYFEEVYLPPKGIEDAKRSEIAKVNDKETFVMTADIVKKDIGRISMDMFGYNEMIPGPFIIVDKGSRIKVDFKNNLDQNTTVHWHGLRHDVKDDGVPGVSQQPISPGESFSYDLFFPDNGIFWYHPHVREDIQQELGLSGNILVVEEGYFNKVNREEVLILDDMLIEDDNHAQFGKDEAKYAIMGRFGNIMLLNGKTDYSLDVNKGDVIRFYLTNVANVRPFNISFGGARMKLIGSDLGKYEREEYVSSIVIAPAERYIVEVYFQDSGDYKIENINPHKRYSLGKVIASRSLAEIDYFQDFNVLKTNQAIVEDISRYREYFNKQVDYTLELDVDMPGMMGGMMQGMMDHLEESENIEWEDTMKMMNEKFDSGDLKWQIHDKKTGRNNMDLMMDAKIGDKVKIRLVNKKDSMHPMQHPIHLHGQRFLVISKDGKQNDNLVWKDTVLVPVGSTVDILVDVTNPGEWMMHCHIAEHLESGMMTTFKVEE